jgi:hypothetical protein
MDKICSRVLFHRRLIASGFSDIIGGEKRRAMYMTLEWLH